MDSNTRLEEAARIAQQHAEKACGQKNDYRNSWVVNAMLEFAEWQAKELAGEQEEGWNTDYRESMENTIQSTGVFALEGCTKLAIAIIEDLNAQGFQITRKPLV